MLCGAWRCSSTLGALPGDSRDSGLCLGRVNPAVEGSGWVQKKGDSSENEDANQMGRGGLGGDKLWAQLSGPWSCLWSGKAQVRLLSFCTHCGYSVHTKTGSPGPSMNIAIENVALCEENSNCLIWETNQPTKPGPPSITKPSPSERGGPPGCGTQLRQYGPAAFPFPLLVGLRLLRLWHSSGLGNSFILLKREGHCSTLKKHSCLLEFQIV